MRTAPILIALVLMAAQAAAAQTVFRCLDGAGKVGYQGQPCAQEAKQSEVRVRDDAPDPSAQPRQSPWKGHVPPKVAAWASGCEVRLAYGGRRPARLPGTPEHVPIRWAPEYMRMAHPADARSGIAGTGSLAGGLPRLQRVHEAAVRRGLPAAGRCTAHPQRPPHERPGGPGKDPWQTGTLANP